MISALHKNLRYLRYISAILSAVWRVTAELNEIVQYFKGRGKGLSRVWGVRNPQQVEARVKYIVEVEYTKI